MMIMNKEIIPKLNKAITTISTFCQNSNNKYCGDYKNCYNCYDAFPNKWKTLELDDKNLETEVNNAIKTLRSYCRVGNGCKQCLFYNHCRCDTYPDEWKQI